MSLLDGFDASAYDFSEGLACVDVNERLRNPDQKAAYGFVDREGNIKIPAIYDAAYAFHEGFAAVKLNNKWGFIDTKGNTAISFTYDSADSFTRGLALVQLNGKYGSIDMEGNTIIAVIYDLPYFFAYGRALVHLDGKYGYIDTKGNKAAMSASEAERYFREGME